jgi:hypothetical protein
MADGTVAVRSREVHRVHRLGLNAPHPRRAEGHPDGGAMARTRPRFRPGLRSGVSSVIMVPYHRTLDEGERTVPTPGFG